MMTSNRVKRPRPLTVHVTAAPRPRAAGQRIGVALAWLVACAGCGGGQTGESGTDDCVLEYHPVSVQTELPSGETLTAWAERFAGTRAAPLHWMDRTACATEGADERKGPLCDFPDPGETESTSELELILENRGIARETVCGGRVPSNPAAVDMQAGADAGASTNAATLRFFSMAVGGRFRSADGRADVPFEGQLEPAVFHDIDAEIGARLQVHDMSYTGKFELWSGGMRGFVERGLDAPLRGSFPVPAWSECRSQPSASDVSSPVAVTQILSTLNSLNLKAPALFRGEAFKLGVATWRDHACLITDGAVSERGSYSGYRIWVDATFRGPEGTPTEPLIGTVDVAAVDDCLACARVTLSVGRSTATGQFVGTLPSQRQVNSSLALDGLLESDTFDMTSARLRLNATGSGGEELVRFVDLELEP